MPRSIFRLAALVLMLGAPALAFAAVPTVTTLGSSPVTATSEVLGGRVDQTDGATTSWLRYSTVHPTTCNDTFGTRVPASGGIAVGSGTSYQITVTGLLPDTSYYYCAIAANGSGTGFGLVGGFHTGDQCANGVIDTDLGEQCDDGNRIKGDGCSPACQVEAGYQCAGSPSICVNLCGNGIIDAAEQCDGANLGGQTCQSLGTPGGTLSCNANCTYNFSGCVGGGCPDADGDGYTEASCGGTDCNDTNPAVHPGAAEVCDGLDNDCNGATDDVGSSGCGGGTCGNGTVDTGEQCDGANLGGQTCQSLGTPGGTLSCNANCTYNFSGCVGGGCPDADGDGYTEASCGGTDCNDTNPAVHPGAAEVCDGLDNDCNGATDDVGSSGCGGGTCGNGILESGEQCDGANLGGHTCATLGYPGGTLSCNTACSFYTFGCVGGGCPDADGDGYTEASCGGTDCNDTNPAVHPGATEVCDGLDNDCNGATDDVGSSGCGGGTCGNGTIDTGEQCDGANLGGQTCQSLGTPGGTLSCNANCTYNFSGCVGGGCPDADGDGYTEASCGGTDCNDTNPAVHPGAAEVCDGLDNDCNGATDDVGSSGCGGGTCGNGILESGEQCDGANLGGHTCATLGYPGGTLSCNTACSFYTFGCVGGGCPDADGDGYTEAACGGTDCNDTNPAVHPGAAELCNGLDNNCNGATDDGCGGGTVNVCIGSAIGDPGQTVTVPIFLEPGQGVSGFQIDTGFDPGLLTAAGVRLGTDTTGAGGWFIYSAPVGAGELRVLADSSPPSGLVPAGRDEVALVDFEIAGSAPFGAMSPFTLGNCVLSDDHGVQIPCNFCPNPGRVTVRSAASFSFGAMDFLVGVDMMDPLPFPATVEALTFGGAPASDYNSDAAMSVGPACPGALQPDSLSFSSGHGNGTFTIACCLDSFLPMTQASLMLHATDPAMGITGSSGVFTGVAKSDVNADDAVNVLDVVPAIMFALGLPVSEPPAAPPVTFQRWAANMLDQTCAVDTFINVLDIVRIRNKALARPALCPCTSGQLGGPIGEQAHLAVPVTPLSISLEKDGPREFVVKVRGAVDLSGLQIELRAAGPQASVSIEGLTAGKNWQGSTTLNHGVLRVVMFSNAATGISGDGVVLRIKGGGSPSITSVVASDSEGRAVPLR